MEQKRFIAIFLSLVLVLGLFPQGGSVAVAEAAPNEIPLQTELVGDAGEAAHAEDSVSEPTDMFLAETLQEEVAGPVLVEASAATDVPVEVAEPAALTAEVEKESVSAEPTENLPLTLEVEAAVTPKESEAVPAEETEAPEAEPAQASEPAEEQEATPDNGQAQETEAPEVMTTQVPQADQDGAEEAQQFSAEDTATPESGMAGEGTIPAEETEVPEAEPAQAPDSIEEQGEKVDDGQPQELEALEEVNTQEPQPEHEGDGSVPEPPLEEAVDPESDLTDEEALPEGEGKLEDEASDEAANQSAKLGDPSGEEADVPLLEGTEVLVKAPAADQTVLMDTKDQLQALPLAVDEFEPMSIEISFDQLSVKEGEAITANWIFHGALKPYQTQVYQWITYYSDGTHVSEQFHYGEELTSSYIPRENGLYCELYVAVTGADGRHKGEFSKHIPIIGPAGFVKEISLSEVAHAMYPGDQVMLVATVAPNYANDKSVTWSSSNTAVAEVSGAGLVTAKSVGTAIITATSKDGSNVAASCRIEVLEDAITLPQPYIYGFSCGVRSSSGTDENYINFTIGAQLGKDPYRFTYRVYRYSTLVYTGTSEKAGEITIAGEPFTQDGYYKIALDAFDALGHIGTIVTKNIKISSQVIEINDPWGIYETPPKVYPTAIEIYYPGYYPGFMWEVGMTSWLNVRFKPEPSIKKVKWASSDTSIATVDEYGRVTCKKTGRVTITAETIDGTRLKASCIVEVVKAVKEIYIGGNTSSMVVGQTITLPAIVYPVDATDKRILWSSNDETVISIDENGRLTALRPGIVKITAAACDGSAKEATLELRVTQPVTEIQVLNIPKEMHAGELFYPQTIVKPNTVSDARVAWSSSDEQVILVDSNGVIKAKKIGKASITVTAMDGSGVKTTYTVTVLPIDGLIQTETFIREGDNLNFEWKILGGDNAMLKSITVIEWFDYGALRSKTHEYTLSIEGGSYGSAVIDLHSNGNFGRIEGLIEDIDSGYKKVISSEMFSITDYPSTKVLSVEDKENKELGSAIFRGNAWAQGFAQIGANRYYAKDNGLLQTGWFNIGEDRCFAKEDGVLQTGWVKDGGSWYYMKNNGAMATGWVYDSAWYYMNSSGVMATGWLKDGGSWYYLNSSGAMATGWVYDNAWYYMQSSGAMATGWVNDGGTWYYMSDSGAMSTGWVYSGNQWYYMDGSGAMATGYRYIDGRRNLFDTSGVWLGYR